MDHCAEAIRTFVGEGQHILYVPFGGGWSWNFIRGRLQKADFGFASSQLDVLLDPSGADENTAAANKRKIEWATCIWFGGGKPITLLEKLQALGPLYVMLGDAIDSGRVKLVGVSAGTIVPSMTLSTANDKQQEGQPALGIFPFHVHPHWLGASELEPAQHLRTAKTIGPVLSLDSDAWATFENGQVQVHGKARASALSWRKVGTTEPTEGTAITHVNAPQLAAALASKDRNGERLVFKQAEWDTMAIVVDGGLTMKHYIKGGDEYFTPHSDRSHAMIFTKNSRVVLAPGDRLRYTVREDGTCRWQMEHFRLTEGGLKLQYSFFTPRRINLMYLADVRPGETMRLAVSEDGQFGRTSKMALQAFLKHKGLYEFGIDGDFGISMLDDVKKVQKLMNDMAVAGTPDGGEPPAGDFQYLQTQLAKDPEGFLKTVERINGAPFGNSGSTKALQRLLGIKADGFFGARPWIERWVAHHLDSPSCARCSLTHHLVCFVLAGTFSVKALQNWCNLEGATRWGDDWVTCSVDGVWGPKTATAMQKVISSKEVEFQKVFSNMFVSGHFGKQSKIALQAFLKMRDVYHDPVNGDFGSRAPSTSVVALQTWINQRGKDHDVNIANLVKALQFESRFVSTPSELPRRVPL